MTTSPSKPPVDRSSPDALRVSRLLAALATTPDSELGAFGRRKCPAIVNGAPLRFPGTEVPSAAGSP